MEIELHVFVRGEDYLPEALELLGPRHGCISWSWRIPNSWRSRRTGC